MSPQRWVAAALLAVACSEPAAEGRPESVRAAAVEPARPPAPEPAPTASGCRDFGDLDVSTLPELPAGPHVAVLDAVWRRVLDKYYDPTIGCLDWPALRLQYAAKVAAAPDRTSAYRIVNEMLDQLGQSHFELVTPGGDDTPPLGPAAPDVTVRLIEDALVVTRSGESAVKPGLAVLAVDGRSTGALIDRAKAQGKRPAEVAFEARRAIEAWLSCERPGERRAVTFERRDETTVDETLACGLRKGELITLGNLSDVPTLVEHRMLDGGVGYLAFNVWMLPMVDRIRAGLAQLRAGGMKALVLDLRGNPGGVGPMSVSVGRMLLAEKADLGKLQYRKFAQSFVVDPDADAFTGPLAILVDEGTASTSEIFAAGMHDLGRATIVGGGPSAGAALPSVIEELPGGAVLQYVVGDYHSPKGTVIEGRGVVPDILVPERRADFAAGRDPVLEAAAAHLAAAPVRD